MHRRLLALFTIPGLNAAASLLTDEQLAGIARWLGLADVEVLADMFPHLAEEIHHGQ